jgi:hypothetical protein
MFETVGGLYAGDMRVAALRPAPIATPHQGRAMSATASGNLFGSGWRLRGKGATTIEPDSVSGALPA